MSHKGYCATIITNDKIDTKLYKPTKKAIGFSAKIEEEYNWQKKQAKSTKTIRNKAKKKFTNNLTKEITQIVILEFLKYKITQTAEKKLIFENELQNNPKAIWITADRGKIQIQIENITCCISENNNTDFWLLKKIDWLDNKRKIGTSISIGNWEDALKFCVKFLRIHRRVIVNIDNTTMFKDGHLYIKEIKGEEVDMLEDGKYIPVNKFKVTDSYKENLLQRLKNYSA